MLNQYLPPNIGIYLNKKPIIDIKSLIEKQSTKYVICIDGLAGSGKSTLGKHLADILKIPHISSGIFYRVYTYIFCLYHLEFTPENIDKLTHLINFEIHNQEFTIIYNQNKIPLSELKNDVIDAALNRFSSNLYFRDQISKVLIKMVKTLQQSFILDLRGASPEYVLEVEKENRPVIRLLLVAETNTKASRRLKEYMNLKYSKDEYYKTPNHQQELYNSLKKKIEERDAQDLESIAQTGIGLVHKQTGIIDSTDITEDQVTQLALQYIEDILI